jgi:hypothetical protein
MRADFPLHDCSPCRGLHARRESPGVSSFKGPFLCRPVPVRFAFSPSRCDRCCAQDIWEKIPKDVALRDKRLADYFDIEYVGMASFELAEEQFKADAAVLRNRLTSPPGVPQAIVRTYPPSLPLVSAPSGSEFGRSRALGRRPPNPSDKTVARTEGYTPDANEWVLCLVQGPFSFPPCKPYSFKGHSLFLRANPIRSRAILFSSVQTLLVFRTFTSRWMRAEGMRGFAATGFPSRL